MTELERVQMKIDVKKKKILNIEERLGVLESQRSKVLNDLKVLGKKKETLEGEQVGKFLAKEGLELNDIMQLVGNLKKQENGILKEDEIVAQL